MSPSLLFVPCLTVSGLVRSPKLSSLASLRDSSFRGALSPLDGPSVPHSSGPKVPICSSSRLLRRRSSELNGPTASDGQNKFCPDVASLHTFARPQDSFVVLRPNLTVELKLDGSNKFDPEANDAHSLRSGPSFVPQDGPSLRSFAWRSKSRPAQDLIRPQTFFLTALRA